MQQCACGGADVQRHSAPIIYRSAASLMHLDGAPARWGHTQAYSNTFASSGLPQGILGIYSCLVGLKRFWLFDISCQCLWSPYFNKCSENFTLSLTLGHGGSSAQPVDAWGSTPALPGDSLRTSKEICHNYTSATVFSLPARPPVHQHPIKALYCLISRSLDFSSLYLSQCFHFNDLIPRCSPGTNKSV